MSDEKTEETASIFDLASFEQVRGRGLDEQVAHPGRDAPRLPKRFYKVATAQPQDGGYAIQLDGKTVKTPSRQPLIVRGEKLAAAIVGEWEAQGEYINPRRMWHTKLANTALDLVLPRRDAVITDIVTYAKADLLCYRAEGPLVLVARQANIWDGLLDWLSDEIGAHLHVTTGIVHVAQEPEALEAIRKAVDAFDAFELTGLHNAVTLTGSAVIGLALLKRHIDAAAAFEAAHLDEFWQMELCGEDEEEAARLALRKSELEATILFVQLAQDAA